jgi:hypothetical protein
MSNASLGDASILRWQASPRLTFINQDAATILCRFDPDQSVAIAGA